MVQDGQELFQDLVAAWHSASGSSWYFNYKVSNSEGQNEHENVFVEIMFPEWIRFQRNKNIHGQFQFS